MERNGLSGFLKFLSDDKEAQTKVQSFGSDIDAFAAFARENGYDVSPEELREYQDKTQKLLKIRAKKQQTNDSISPGAKEFFGLIKLAENDEDVAKRLAELGSGTPEELIAYGKEKGFTFNKQDMEDVGKSILEPSDELSEEELEMVAGGSTLFLFLGVMSAVVIVGNVVLYGAVAIGVALSS